MAWTYYFRIHCYYSCHSNYKKRLLKLITIHYEYILNRKMEFSNTKGVNENSIF